MVLAMDLWKGSVECLGWKEMGDWQWLMELCGYQLLSEKG